MSGFDERMHIGGPHENAVRTALQRRGWLVDWFGQGLFTDATRAALRRRRPVCYLRWLPDLIASKDTRVVLVDAKSEQNVSTENFALELDAHYTHGLIQQMFNIPVVYVWHDFTVNTRDGVDWHTVRYPRTNDERVAGSGTAFMLTRKDSQQPMDKWFGPVTADGGA